MYYHILLKLIIFINLVPWAACWQYFATLSDITIAGGDPLKLLENEDLLVHSEYRFGNCKKAGKLYAHVHKDHMDVLGKIIIREWINVPRIPTCIVLRAKSYEVDMFRSTAYNFQMCVPRITYCHSRKRYKYYYYEWYLPYDMVGGMNWDLYFYGSGQLTWQ